MPLSSTPTSTTCARSWVQTMTTTVAAITTEECHGWDLRLRIDVQEKVTIATTIMTETSDSIVICTTQGARTTLRINRKRTVTKQDIQVWQKPSTFISVRPIHTTN